MDVSIIIINYNTRQMLANCLNSLYEFTKEIQFEVIVVDNASKDGSEQYICSKFPQVKWVNSGGNVGFGRANNLGIKYAKGKYLFLLNSDTLLLNNATKAFYNYAESHIGERIGVLGCWLYDNEGKPNKSFGEFPTPSSEIRYLFQRFGVSKNLQHAGIKDVDYIIGADMFIRRDVFDDFEGFDPNFFMYYEETDLQYRMAQKGYIRRVIDTPRIVHLEGGSFSNKGLTFNRFIMSQHSYNYYLSKHYLGIKYVIYRIILCVIRIMVLFRLSWTWKERTKGYMCVLISER